MYFEAKKDPNNIVIEIFHKYSISPNYCCYDCSFIIAIMLFLTFAFKHAISLFQCFFFFLRLAQQLFEWPKDSH